MELDPFAQRALGCLIEKRTTTPDVYPLSLNARRTACNQSTNRDPVMHVDDEQVRDACQTLHRHGLARLASSAGSRTIKYRHLAHEALNVGDAELALLAVLLLRGPQTVGELRSRSERLFAFASLDAVTAVLDQLGRRGLIVLLDREPGRKEARYAHQLGARASVVTDGMDEPPQEPHVQDGANGAAFTAVPLAAPTANPDALEARVAALEARVAELEALLE
jgi:uncharacterized protein YceH (UPF0502 family)